MRKVILSVLFATLILFDKSEVHAQESLTKDKSCQPSAEEILSVIKSVYNLSPLPEGVLIAGEVWTGHIRGTKEVLSLPQTSEWLSLTQTLATIGGVLKTANHTLYLIRQSAEDKTKIKLEIDLREIKQGRAKDVWLEKGDVVFVSRGCVDGKLLPPLKPVYRRMPPGVDYPINIPNKRNAR